MKRRDFIQKTAVSSAILTLGGLSLSSFSSKKTKRITILHTNDTHSHIDPFPTDHSKYPNMGGAARRASYINKIREENPNTLLFDAGDMFQGTPYFNYYGGELEFKIMNMLKYDAATLGNHEFDNGLETRIVRIFNTYGPRMRLNDGRVIPAFMGQALRGEDLTIFGDGNQTRSFCYIDDQVEGIYRLLFSEYHLPVNIGNPDEITINEFAQEILELTETNNKIVYHPLPINDPLQRQPDITKAKDILDWEPKVGRTEGMQITFNYFKTLSAEELKKEEHKDFSKYIK